MLADDVEAAAEDPDDVDGADDPTPLLDDCADCGVR